MAQTASFLIDTNILVHLMRNDDLGQWLERTYNLRATLGSSMISVVVIGEILSLARQFHWKEKKLDELKLLVDQLVHIDINSDDILSAYGELDAHSRSVGRRMGKNDLWIAATARVVNAAILTTDKDFDHLDPTFLTRIYIDLTNYDQTA
ncbi:MAG: type II toxin-antitoxin system VapC family toxin [Pirellulaceae bacterium]|nr:type II toxin-antitoxin system VapC family toxin [Pirellulaceae bacterium]